MTQSSFPTVNLSMNSLNLVIFFWILTGKLLHVVKVSCTLYRNYMESTLHMWYISLDMCSKQESIESTEKESTHSGKTRLKT